MFHYTNFGMFGGELQRFADSDGYVPEDGDKLEAFHYPSGWFDDDLEHDDWDEHVRNSVQATERAEEALSEWRNA